MKHNFVVGLLGGLIGAAMLLILLNVTGIVGARSVEVRSDVSRTNEVSAATPLTSTFTYQGQLKNGGNAVNGLCDIAFRLYDDPAAGNLIGSPITPTVPVTNGLFTVGLNFGSNGNVFDGNDRWLDIQVKCGVGSFVALTSRQALTPAPYALYAKGNWSLTGNAGTNPSTNFIGTIDNVMLTVRVSDTTALRIMSTDSVPNIIGGFIENFISSTVVGSVIGGGGSGGGEYNRVLGNYGTVGGGLGNAASNDRATVGGGLENLASGNSSSVGGGWANHATNGNATIAGGFYNTASGGASSVGGGAGNTASNGNATIGGGYNNTASGDSSSISGGYGNVISSTGSYAFIGGGISNIASGIGATIAGGGYDGTTVTGNQAIGNVSTIGGGIGNAVSGNLSTIGGGKNNTAGGNGVTIGGGADNTTSNDGATIGGGKGNDASGQGSTIGGGHTNTASNDGATIGGGDNNAANGDHATIGGGSNNAANGYVSTVPGGVSNIAQGDFSFAAGVAAKANHAGTFVWGDSTDASIYSSGNDQFIVRANGGFAFVTATTDFTPTIDPGVFITTSTGAYLSTAGVWTNANGSSKPSNVIVVAKSGGDFNTISAALSSITDNSAANRYLIYVAPGTYTETVTMKEYVDIEGAGELMTKITQVGSAGGDTGTVVGASNAELRFLTVENTGGDSFAIAIHSDSTSPHLTHVTAKSSGGTGNTIGVDNVNSSSTLMNNVTVILSASVGLNGGVYALDGASPTINNSVIQASGGIGIINIGTITATVLVNSSQISSTNQTIYNESGYTTRVSTSQLSGGAVYNNGTLTCIYSYNASYAALNATCN
jgi:hypothetical protein